MPRHSRYHIVDEAAASLGDASPVSCYYSLLQGYWHVVVNVKADN